MTNEREKLPVDDFQEVYELREQLVKQYGEASQGSQDTYDAAIDGANSRLTELVADPEVRAFLLAIGGPVVEASRVVEVLTENGLVSSENKKKTASRLDEMKEDPRVAMALEFFPDGASETTESQEEWRSEKTATKEQLDFAKSLNLDLDPTITKKQARNLITLEVKRIGHQELEESAWKPEQVIDHARYGKCSLAKIHKKSAQVTLKPLDGGRSVVVHAMSLKPYSRASQKSQE